MWIDDFAWIIAHRNIYFCPSIGVLTAFLLQTFLGIALYGKTCSRIEAIIMWVDKAYLIQFVHNGNIKFLFGPFQQTWGRDERTWHQLIIFEEVISVKKGSFGKQRHNFKLVFPPSWEPLRISFFYSKSLWRTYYAGVMNKCWIFCHEPKTQNR